MTTPEQLAETVREGIESFRRVGVTSDHKRVTDALAALDSLLAAYEEMRRERDTDGLSVHLLGSFYENLIRDAKRAEAAERRVKELEGICDENEEWRMMFKREKADREAAERSLEKTESGWVSQVAILERKRDALREAAHAYLSVPSGPGDWSQEEQAARQELYRTALGSESE